MKIDVENREDHQVKVTVEVENSLLDITKKRAARQISKKTKIPGFRPGKAPYNVILRTIGEEAVHEEAIELLVKEIYPKALDEAKIEPYGPGILENFTSSENPVFEFIVPLRAKVELGAYGSIRLPYEPSEVPEGDVDKLIKSLQDQHAVIEPVERVVQEGDLVYIKLSAEKLEPEVEAETSLIEERSLPVNVYKEEDESSVEWPFSGFSRKLIGLSAGEKSSFEYQYPEDASFSAFKNAHAKFNIEIESVKSRILPELNAEFAQTVGDFETIDALRAQVRTNLEEQNTADYNQQYDEQVLDRIVEDLTINYPPQMVEHEIEHVIEHLQERLVRQGMSMDLYLKSRELESEGLREEARPVAETRLKRSLALLNLAEIMKIEVSPDDLQAATNRTLEGYARYMPEGEFTKFVENKENASGLVESVMMDLVIARTQERLRQIARGLESEPAEPEDVKNEAEQTAGETTPVTEVVDVKEQPKTED